MSIKSLFFTGHRPNKLPGGYKGYPEYEVKLVIFLRAWIIRAYEKGFRDFICGGALGMDQAAALAVIGARYGYKDITLSHYLPFRGFECKWPEEARRKFESIDNRADLTTYICDPPYEAWKMNKRNQAMVDNAECGIALWNGGHGGTANCIEYAAKKNVPVVIINPETFEYTWQLNK